jgi:hypothetical protein
LAKELGPSGKQGPILVERKRIVNTEFLTTQDVLARVNAAHRLEFVLRRRCAGGLQGGAWLLADPTGARAVLKWERAGSVARIEELAAAVALIRVAGYPTPAWLAAGATSAGIAYHVQEFVAGEASTPLTPARAELLIGVLERQAGLDPGLAAATSIADAALARAPRRALHQMGTVGRDLIRRYDSVLDAAGPIALPAGDLVHGDFNSCNILLRDGRVAGVIDVTGMSGGSRVVDYACLLREAYVEGYGAPVIAIIRRAAEAVAGPAALAWCVTAAALFIAEFKMRHEPYRIIEIIGRLRQLADSF